MSETHEMAAKKLRRSFKRNEINIKKGTVLIWNGKDWENSDLLLSLSKSIHLKNNKIDELEKKVDMCSKLYSKIYNDLYI